MAGPAENVFCRDPPETATGERSSDRDDDDDEIDMELSVDGDYPASASKNFAEEPLPVSALKSAAASHKDGRKSPNKRGLRRGKWTAEEEAYVERIIHDFENGLLPVGVGVTLRSYLSEKLNCDPMRITKKFTGSASIGKRIFHPCERTPATADSLARAHRELKDLDVAWLERLEQHKREKRDVGKAPRRASHASSFDSNSCSSDGTASHGERRRRRDEYESDPALQHHEANCMLAWLSRAHEALQEGSMVPLDVVDRLVNEGETFSNVLGGRPEVDDDDDDDEACWKRPRADDNSLIEGLMYLKRVGAGALANE
jgi:hypothetical protein